MASSEMYFSHSEDFGLLVCTTEDVAFHCTTSPQVRVFSTLTKQ